MFRNALVLPLVLAIAFASRTPAAAQTAGMKVVVTSKPIHSLVAAVMTGAGTPALLIDGAASPHSYAMRPSDAKLVNNATVFFRVSEALEPFTAKVVRALPRTVKVATLAEAPNVKLLQRRSGGTFEAHKHTAHGHKPGAHNHDAGSESAYDAHVWLDPDNAKAMVASIAAVLTEHAPNEAPLFSANAAALNKRLDALAQSLAHDLSSVANRPFVVLHDAYQYFERRFGMSAIGSILVDPDEQPSARRLTDLRRKVAGLGAVCVFSEPSYQLRVVTSVIEGSKARTAVLDPEGTMLPPGPDHYFKLMEQMATAMKGCLTTPS